jgi:hypothetical protein
MAGSNPAKTGSAGAYTGAYGVQPKPERPARPPWHYGRMATSASQVLVEHDGAELVRLLNELISEDGMRRSTLIGWLLTLGVALWLASSVVDTQPAYALAVGLAVVTFSAFAAARPYRRRDDYKNKTNPMNTPSQG